MVSFPGKDENKNNPSIILKENHFHYITSYCIPALKMIVYTYPIPTAFTDRDIAMLQAHVKVKPLVFTNDPLKLPFYFLLQFFQLLFFLPHTSSYLCFFAGYHSVLPTFFGRVFKIKVYIQCGGTDAMNMPEINYGNFRKKWLRKATVYSFKNCSKILPVAESLIRQEYRYDAQIQSKQGLLHLIPGLKTPIQVIHNGFDHLFWKDDGGVRPLFSFITVATGISIPNRAAVKGIDLILNLARQFPAYSFTLVGDDEFKCGLPNVQVMGKCGQHQLRDLFNRHQFYLQLSTSEGFPNALAEAMLCGCIPIGSAVGAIPKIIGDTGFILEQKSAEKLEKLMSNIAEENLEPLRRAAAKRVLENFSYKKRQEALLQVLGLADEG